ncbi:ABC transporter permease [Bacillus horti]|uniref:ABC transport system permease protein n=1 Tax=Caldalkalibacillus horti TaxID=77523 RepID=A0ABT9W239_9BACI|nr:ABC transporter permease [Bacillus horti]MDQ0167320.1 putative ABC transport system permease protein [Bacillus horti]
MAQLYGAIEIGLIFAIMALGVYITFRILNFPDLTVDGSFTSGGAVAAVMIVSGVSPLLSTFSALIVGFIFGCFTGIIHTKGKINGLLAGILAMIALYSINLRIMGRPNVALISEETLKQQVKGFFSDYLPFLARFDLIIAMALVVLLIKLALDWFLKTEIGMAIRATGDNQRMIRSYTVNTDISIILGVGLSNGLVALSGALFAQYQGNANATMGVGMIIIGLASVIIGEAIFGTKTLRRVTMAVAGGSIIYYFAVSLALRLGLNASDLRLITAIIVIFALVAPQIMKALHEKRKRAIRQQQADQVREEIKS